MAQVVPEQLTDRSERPHRVAGTTGIRKEAMQSAGAKAWVRDARRYNRQLPVTLAGERNITEIL